MQELMLGVLLILAIAWLVVRIRQNKAAQSAPPKLPDKTGVYHAVAIKYSENACDAAKAMTGRRFLSSAAPRLPLPDCDYMDCRCVFAHHKDRRTNTERRSPFASGRATGSTGLYEKERRETQDRRSDNDADPL
jgi:hypothetical protein